MAGFIGFLYYRTHLLGWKLAKRIDTGSVVATPENMDDLTIKNLLEPDFKKWLDPYAGQLVALPYGNPRGTLTIEKALNRLGIKCTRPA